MTLYPKLVRNVLLPLSLWRAGELAQMRYLREFERSQFLSSEEVRHLQWRRLQALLEHAYGQCPFYRQRFDRAGLKPSDLRRLEDLRALPVLEKRDIQEQGDDMVARNWPRGDLIRNQTGGSTGAPVAFYLSKARKCSRAAATLRHNRWAGWEVGDRAAVIWGARAIGRPTAWRGRLRGALLRDPLWLDTANVTEASLAEFHIALAQLAAAHHPGVCAFGRAVRPVFASARSDAASTARHRHLGGSAGNGRAPAARRRVRLSGVQSLRLP